MLFVALNAVEGIISGLLIVVAFAVGYFIRVWHHEKSMQASRASG